MFFSFASSPFEKGRAAAPLIIDLHLEPPETDFIGDAGIIFEMFGLHH